MHLYAPLRNKFSTATERDIDPTLEIGAKGYEKYFFLQCPMAAVYYSPKGLMYCTSWNCVPS